MKVSKEGPSVVKESTVLTEGAKLPSSIAIVEGNGKSAEYILQLLKKYTKLYDYIPKWMDEYFSDKGYKVKFKDLKAESPMYFWGFTSKHPEDVTYLVIYDAANDKIKYELDGKHPEIVINVIFMNNFNSL